MRNRFSRPLALEALESRCLLDAAAAAGDIEPRMITYDNPAFHLADPDQFTGVVALWITYQDYSESICTGVLLDDKKHILFAAQCATDLDGNNIVREVEVWIYHPDGLSIYRQVDPTRIAIHPDWQGIKADGSGVLSGADLAVLALPQRVTEPGVEGYPLYENTDEVGQEGYRVGFGAYGVGGNDTRISDPTRKIYGRNRYDAKAEDFNALLPGNPIPNDRMLLFDFDNGNQDNDAAGALLGVDDTGVDPITDEAFPCFLGDQGSPMLIESGGQLYVAGIFSFAISYDELTNDANGPDIDEVTNCTFGELGFDIRVSNYVQWINDMRGQGPPPPQPTYTSYLVAPGGPGVMTMSDGTLVAYDGADILAVVLDDQGQFQAVEVYFDGSDVGLDASAGETIQAFTIDNDGNLYLSLANKGLVDSIYGPLVVGLNDIIKFNPTKLGRTTQGTWEWFFDGSDVGLFGPEENIDGLAFLPSGDLVISTQGVATLPDGSGGVQIFDNADLLQFTPSTMGWGDTQGSWTLLQDGATLGLNGFQNNLNALWIDTSGTKYGFSVAGRYTYGGLNAQNEDLLLFRTTTNLVTALLNLTPLGFAPHDIQGMHVLPGNVIPTGDLTRRLLLAGPIAATDANSSAAFPWALLASHTAEEEPQTPEVETPPLLRQISKPLPQENAGMASSFESFQPDLNRHIRDQVFEHLEEEILPTIPENPAVEEIAELLSV